ncbi:MAG: ribosome silencing factor [Desulfobacteraceae bacterium]|nr:ribosome silencing factor [Desulfobacteraceae bacterium]MCP4346019.1 ribosome silencing factor [Desulfobacterales bacterium]
MTNEYDQDLDLYVNAVLGKKVFSVTVLDVRELTSIADVFIICSGRSNRQVSAITDYIVAELKEHGKRPLNTEGAREGHWALIDYGHVIIHVFYEPVREFYDLEGLWTDAKRIKTGALLKHEEQEAEAEQKEFETELL